jgi:hypothetical protein
MKKAEDPLIRINWRRIGRIIKGLFLATLRIIKKIVEKVLILIFKFLTKVVLFILWLYKKTKYTIKQIKDRIQRFGESEVSGYYVLIVTFIYLVVTISIVLFQFRYEYIATYKSENQIKVIKVQEGFIKDKDKEIQELKDKILELNSKLEAKAKEEAIYAHQQSIITNRNNAEKNLPTEVKDLVAKYASIYGVEDIRLMDCIIYHESGGRDEVVGDSGAAKGVCQYHLATFLGHRKQMGLEEIDLRTDTEASIQAMMFSISHGGIENWMARTYCM